MVCIETEASNLPSCPVNPIIMDRLPGELRWLGPPIRFWTCQVRREKRNYSSGSIAGKSEGSGVLPWEDKYLFNKGRGLDIRRREIQNEHS